MAGASCSACRRPPASRTSPSTAPWSPNATDTWAVAVSIASTSTSVSRDRGDQRVAAPGPRDAGGLERHRSLVVVGTQCQVHVEAVGGEQRAHAVAPLHDGHRVAPHEVVEPEVVQLLQVVEPVHVDVHERRGGVVFAHDGERGAHDRLADAERDRDPLGEHGLAGAELAVEHHDVAGAQQRADAAPERVGLVGGARRRRQLHGVPVARARARLTTTKSARACARAVPPLRNTADGWNTGMSTPSRYGNSRPRSLVMPSLVESSSLVAKLPSVTTTFGSMNATWASR